MTVSFSKYLPWQAMHFLQRSTHFSKNVLQTVDYLEISCLGAPSHGQKSQDIAWGEI
jgi:hypothetical protein